MKFNWLITFRSVTYAQKAERLLKRSGVECMLQRTPRELSERGCGYCLRLRGRDAMQAAELLRSNGVLFGKIYAVSGDGKTEERVV